MIPYGLAQNYTTLRTKMYILLLTCVIFTIVYVVGFNETHWNGISAEDDSNVWRRSLNRFYFALTTHSTCGFGDISPKSTLCRLIVSVHLIVILVITFL